MNQPSRLTPSSTVEFWIACLLGIFAAISLRLTELPLWQDAAFFIDGEHLLATHDAYAWLAGAKGLGQWSAAPFTLLLKQLQSLTGLDLAFIGFWAPVFFVPLLAIPICLLAKALRLPEGGLVFGILATTGLGFLVRTRLGFCDTDIVNLLFPVSSLCVLALWLEDLFSASRNVGRKPFSFFQSAAAALACGLAGKAALWLYPGSSSVLLPGFCLAIAVAVFFLRSDARPRFINGMLLILGITFAGWLGGILAGTWILVHRRIRDTLPLGAYIAIVVGLGGALFFLGNLNNVIGGLVYRLYLYTKVGTPDMVNNATGLKLPDIAQSVREAQNLPWGQMAERMAGSIWLFFLGVTGFGFVCWRRPQLVVFLPFLGLGIASVKLGNRFTMYGTIGIGLGLGLGLAEFLALLRQSQGRRWIAQLLLACLVLWPSAQLMQRINPVPVLPRLYAQTFLDLRELAEPDALLWQWWDYGYAGQYYAERATMGDGARQSGPWLHPLAKVHSATTPLAASQLMRYFGHAMLEDGLRRTDNSRDALFLGNPVSGLRQIDALAAQALLAKLMETPQTLPSAIPQYLVLSWENLRLASWISYYGNWDVFTGSSAPGKIQNVQGKMEVDSELGTISLGGNVLRIDSIDIIEDGGLRSLTWGNGSGFHVVINQLSKQVYLMDSKMYESMMVQMLLQPPQNFSEHFTLVVDKYPWNRVYKLR